MITSTADFNAVIGKACAKALDHTLDMAMQALRQSMDTVVYNGYSPVTYGRTGQLKTAWKKNPYPTSGGGSFSGGFQHEPSYMTSVPEIWWHGSKINGGDYREHVLDAVISGYTAYGNGTTQIPSRDVWSHFLNKFDKNFDRWFRAGLRNAGLTIV